MSYITATTATSLSVNSLLVSNVLHFYLPDCMHTFCRSISYCLQKDDVLQTTSSSVTNLSVCRGAPPPSPLPAYIAHSGIRVTMLDLLVPVYQGLYGVIDVVCYVLRAMTCY